MAALDACSEALKGRRQSSSISIANGSRMHSIEMIREWIDSGRWQIGGKEDIYSGQEHAERYVSRAIL